MIRKLSSGEYRLYSRKRNPQSGRRRNLGTFKTREAAGEQLRPSRRPDDEAIHELRKSIKKVRAILQLIEDDEGARTGGSEKRLHRVSVMLSRLRDADAMMEILAKLMKRNPHLFNEH